MPLPDERALRWIVSRYARLRAAHGEVLGTPELVLPTAEFFPDEVTATPEGIEILLRRMLGYAPVAHGLPVKLGFVAPDESAGGGGGCSSAGCDKPGTPKIEDSGRVVELEDGYGLTLSVGDVGHPVLLTSTLARGVGGLVLAEADEAVPPAEQGATSEIAAVACGLGVLLLNGSHVVAKACGGLRMHQGTHLPVDELAVSVALFLRVHEKKPAAARSHLATTQREEFDEAMRWVDSNDALVDALAHAPASLADGHFAIEPVRGVLARWLAGRKRPQAPSDLAVPASKRPPKTEAERARLAEARALVEKALAGESE